MGTRPSYLSPQFETIEQQHETRTFGVWVFLLTELMLFGGLFAIYAAYRFLYPQGFAEASGHLEATLGAINTGILIISSLTMALSIQSLQTGSRRGAMLFLALTMIFGATFMVIKGIEYYHHYADELVPGIAFRYEGQSAHTVELFMLLYFAMTGLHAIHLAVGIGLVGVMLLFTWRGRVSPEYWTPVEMTGLYWHFVDVIWVLLFPLLYLIHPTGSPF